METASLELAEIEQSFLDYETSIFHDLKKLDTPTLSTLHEKVNRVRHTRWGLYAASIVFTGCALSYIFQPVIACSFALTAVACSITSLYFNKPPPYLILSIDGGGIRGMIPIQILAHIEEKLGRRIGEVFDCIAGTSIGGILALALTQPDPQNPSKPKLGAIEAAQFIENEGPKIFEKSALQSLKSLDGLRAPKYPNDNLKRALNDQFNEAKIDEAVTDILIPSYDLKKGRPAIFFHFKGQKNQEPFLMKDVGMATAAAPTYFPSYPINNLNLVDGGLVANNPAFLAYMKAAGHIDPNRDIYILSLGTGEMLMKSIAPQQSENYGMIQWLPRIFDLMFQSAQEMITLQFKLLKHIAGVPLTFVRLQPKITDPSQENLDNIAADNIQALKQIATKYFEDNSAWLDRDLIQPIRKYRLVS